MSDIKPEVTPNNLKLLADGIRARHVLASPKKTRVK